MSNNPRTKEQLFTIVKNDFDSLYKMADAILSTRPEQSQEYVAADALRERLDLAIEEDHQEIIFNENEVKCLAHVM